MTLRAVVYARFSSDLQRQASIDDQVEVCRRYIRAQGWELTQSYDDRAMSGSSAFRPGFQRLLADAEARRFDVVVCEAIDRLGRNLADVAGFFDRLSFHRVQVHAISLGLVTQMHVGIMGTMAQMYISDLREKTKRGQLGRARAGRIPGGIAYGYDVVPPAPGSKEAGERRINPAEAEIVQRIFRDYAVGKSPRVIARELNQERIPGPGGRPWGDTTIRGQVDRGTGLLNNTLYIGRLSWNRCSYTKDPRTGKRVARVNHADQYEVVEVPELRIVGDELWERVRARQNIVRFEIGRDDGGNALNRAHRRQFLLSGLLTCGCCGGGYTIIGKDRYGCATRRIKGICHNARPISRHHIEARVLSGLRERMLTPALVEEFVRTFEQELAALQRQSASKQARAKDQLLDIEKRLNGVLRAIENGAWNDALKQRLDDLEAQKKQLQAELAAAEAPAPAVKLHPNAAAIYRAKVAELEAALNASEVKAEAADILRSLIERIVLTPDDASPDGLAAELHGDLAMILALSAEAKALPAKRAVNGSQDMQNPQSRFVPGGLLSVVAGTHSHLYRTHVGNGQHPSIR